MCGTYVRGDPGPFLGPRYQLLSQTLQTWQTWNDYWQVANRETKRSLTCRTSNPLGGLSKSKMQPIQVLWQIGVHTYLSRSKTAPITLSRRTFSRHVAYPVRLHLDSHAQHGRCLAGPGDKELYPNPNILRRNPYRSDSDRYECNLKLPPGQKQSWTQLSGERAKGCR